MVVRRELAGGIDPGKQGYMTVTNGSDVVRCDPIPWEGREPDYVAIWLILLDWKQMGVTRVCLEYQQPFSQEGSVSSFTTGGGFMTLKALLAASGLLRGPHGHTTILMPRVWRNMLRITAPQAKLPPLPKKPKPKPKPSKNPELKDWRIANMEAKKNWRADNKRAKSLRGQISRGRKKEGKRLSCELAQKIDPDYDFRRTPRCKGPHDGKAESFLFSWIAYHCV